MNSMIHRYLSKDMSDKNSVQVDILLNGWNDLLNKTFTAIFGPADKVDEFFEGEAQKQLKMLENVYVSYGVWIEMRLIMIRLHSWEMTKCQWLMLMLMELSRLSSPRRVIFSMDSLI